MLKYFLRKKNYKKFCRKSFDDEIIFVGENFFERKKCEKNH
jgi:hypothetical protein